MAAIKNTYTIPEHLQNTPVAVLIPWFHEHYNIHYLTYNWGVMIHYIGSSQLTHGAEVLIDIVNNHYVYLHIDRLTILTIPNHDVVAISYSDPDLYQKIQEALL